MSSSSTISKGVRMPSALWMQLELHAQTHSKTISELHCAAIRALLNNNENEKTPSAPAPQLVDSRLIKMIFIVVAACAGLTEEQKREAQAAIKTQLIKGGSKND